MCQMCTAFLWEIGTHSQSLNNGRAMAVRF